MSMRRTPTPTTSIHFPLHIWYEWTKKPALTDALTPNHYLEAPEPALGRFAGQVPGQQMPAGARQMATDELFSVLLPDGLRYLTH